MKMSAIASLCKFVRFPFFGVSKPLCRGYGAASLQALAEYDCWELPLPVLEDAQGQRIGNGPRWALLGTPGASKGTFASRLAKLLGVPHISMAGLLRKEVVRSTFTAQQIACVVKQGKLVPDSVIFDLLSRRLEHGVESGESGFVLDGFPRTITQAEVLNEAVDIDLVVNLRLREEALTRMCRGRRVCSECGRDFNVATVDFESFPGGPRICMPPQLPPESCLPKMFMRADDAEDVVKEKLRVYLEETKPVENFYRMQGKLLDFEVLGDVSQTWARLLLALRLQDKDATCKQLAA
eukprot:c23539_g1_i1 orf=356-1240(+)